MTWPTQASPTRFKETGSDDPHQNQIYYEATKIPPSIDIGMHYPGCTQAELKALDHAHEWDHQWKHEWRRTPIDKVMRQLTTFLKQLPLQQQQAAINRLNATWNQDQWGPELPIKCFHDLDRAYFDGYLTNKIRLRWKGSLQALHTLLGDTCKGALGASMVDVGKSANYPAVRIILNAKALFLGPPFGIVRKRMVFGVLLHEMVHAYLWLKSDHHEDRDEEARGLDGSHGKSFQKCCWALTKRTERDLGYKVFWWERYDGTGHGRPK